MKNYGRNDFGDQFLYNNNVSHMLFSIASNHNGMAGFWAKKAADQGLIGMAFTNTSPLLAPTRSKKVPINNPFFLLIFMVIIAYSMGPLEFLLHFRT